MADETEESPLLLDRVARRAGCGGDHLRFIGLPGICYALHPSWLTPSHLLPGEKALDCANLWHLLPSSGRINDSGHASQGKASGTLLPRPTVHPLSLPLQADSSPHRGHTPAASAYGIPAGGACRRPYTQKRYCVPPLHPLFSLLFSLIKIMPLPNFRPGSGFDFTCSENAVACVAQAGMM